MRWPNIVPGSWFVLLVAAGGLDALLQELAGTGYPLQLVGRLTLVGMTIVAWPVTRPPWISTRLRVALTVFIASISVSTLTTLFRGVPTEEVWASFLFMYGIAVLLGLFLLAPVVVRGTFLFKLFCAAAVLLGMVQIWRQDLLLPSGFRETYGIVWDDFVNGRVRALSYFASPPRFAELLVLLAGYLQYGLLAGKMRGFRAIVSLVAYAAVMFALYNTYSRSGYVLFLVVSLVQLALTVVRRRSSDRSASPVPVYFSIAFLGSVLTLYLSGRLQVDSSVADSTSLTARQGNWSQAIEGFRAGSWADLLVGTGRSAHYANLTSDYFVLDNVILAILLYSGLLGLLAFTLVSVRVLQEAFNARGSEFVKWDPLIAFYLALFIEGLFVDNHNTIFLVQFSIVGIAIGECLLNGGQRALTLHVQAARPPSSLFRETGPR